MSNSDICAVIVTYHPDAGFADRCARIAGQVGGVAIVDNHSSAATLAALRALPAEVIANPDNRGIAAALNQGAHWAAANGFHWLLLFDQDTVPEPHLAAELLAIAQEHATTRPVGLVGANYHDAFRQRHLIEPRDHPGQRAIETASVITSGSLLSLAAYKVVGPFREDFFIDSIDIEYALRLRERGFAVLLSTKPLMTHAIGAPTWHRFLWKRVACSNHSPLRRYYITRNRLTLGRLYLRRQPRWALAHLRGLFNHCVLTLLYEADRARKLRAITLGAWHALRGVSGKLERAL